MRAKRSNLPPPKRSCDPCGRRGRYNRRQPVSKSYVKRACSHRRTNLAIFRTWKNRHVEAISHSGGPNECRKAHCSHLAAANPNCETGWRPCLCILIDHDNVSANGRQAALYRLDGGLFGTAGIFLLDRDGSPLLPPGGIIPYSPHIRHPLALQFVVRTRPFTGTEARGTVANPTPDGHAGPPLRFGANREPSARATGRYGAG